MVTLLLLAGCGAEFSLTEGRAPPSTEPPPAEEAAPASLEPTALLTRLSIDLRGVRPGVAELEAVEADPAQVDAYRDAWLADARFGAQVRRLFADAYLTRQD